MPIPARYPRHCLFLDCETEPEPIPKDPAGQRHRLKLGIAHWSIMVNDDPTFRAEYIFRTADEFWGIVLPLAERVRDLWTFTHNCAFDWQAAGLFSRVWSADLLLYPPAGSVTFKPGDKGDLNIDGLPFISRFWTRTGARLYGLDTLNWYRSKLSDVGKTFGVRKLPRPRKGASEARLIEYCRQDVRILSLAVGKHAQWCRKKELGKLPPTIASTAHAVWAKHYKPPGYKTHENLDAKLVERLGYFGGRTGCWFALPFDGKCVHSDVSSLFPSAMYDGKFPKSLKRRETDIKPASALTAEECLSMCGRVRLNARSHEYPVRDGDQIWYIRGKFDCWLAGPEILRAYQAGDLVHVGDRNIYVMGELFKQWVLHWFAEKQAARRAGDRERFAYAKMMLVSLYGKFGQKPPRWVLEGFDEIHQDDCVEYETRDDHGTISQFLRIGPMTFRQNEAGELLRANPAVASWVTSHARVRMDNIRAKAAPGRVFYQAVDALYTDQAAYDALKAAGETARDELGKLRWLRNYDGFHAKGANYVIRGGKFSLAGIRSRDTDGKEKAVQVGENTFEQEQFEGMSSMMRRKPDGLVNVRRVKKVMQGGWPRNRVLPDGSVVPVTVDAWGHPCLQDALRDAVRV